MSVIHVEAPLALSDYSDEKALAKISKNLPTGPLAPEVVGGLFRALVATDDSAVSADKDATEASDKAAALLAEADKARTSVKVANVRLARLTYILLGTGTFSSRSLAAKIAADAPERPDGSKRTLGKSRLDVLSTIGRALTMVPESDAVSTFETFETARNSAKITGPAILKAAQEDPKRNPLQVARALVAEAKDNAREAAIESGTVTVPALKASRVTKEADALLDQHKRGGWSDSITEAEKAHAVKQVRALLALIESAPVAPKVDATKVARKVTPASVRAVK